MRQIILMQFRRLRLALFVIVLFVAGCTNPDTETEHENKALGDIGSYALDDIRGLAESGQSEKAIAILLERSARNKGAVKDLLLLADIYLKRGDSNYALSAIDRAQEGGATDQFVALVKAEALMMQGRFQEAEQHLKLVPLTGKKGAKAAVLIAQVRAEEGDIERSRTYFGFAKELAPSAADIDVKRALVEMAAGNFDVAFVLAKQLKENSQLSDKHAPDFILGALSRIRRQPEQAVTYLESALRKSPGDALTQLELVGALLDIQKGDRAEKILDGFLASNPANPLANFYAAYTLWQNGDAAGSRDIILLQDDMLSNYLPAKQLYANASYDVGDYSTAANYFEQYLMEVSNNVEIRLKLADSLRRTGQAQKAIKVVEPIADGQAKLWGNQEETEFASGIRFADIEARAKITALHQIAKADLALNDMESASRTVRQATQQAKQLEIKDDALERSLAALTASIEYRNGAPEAGAILMRKALKIGMPLPEQLVTLANMELSLGNVKAAEEILKHFDSRQETAALKENLSGAIAMRYGEVERAISAFSKAIEADPDYVSAIRNRAIAYGESNRLEESLRDLKKIEPKASHDSQFYALLGKVHQGLGNFGAAINAYESGLKIAPNSAFMNANYAVILTHEKRYTEALEAAIKAAKIFPAESAGYQQLNSLIEKLSETADRASGRSN